MTTETREYSAIIDEGEDVAAFTCGCELRRWTEQDVIEFNYCAMHDATPALLAVAQQLVAANDGEDVDWQDIDDATEAARAAIEEATS